MTAAFSIFLFVIVVVCFLLVVAVMAQEPKGGGLSSVFGGNAQTIGGVKKTRDFLTSATWTLGIALVVLILLSNIFLKSSFADTQGSKLLEGKAVKSSVETAPLEATTPAPSEKENK